MVSASNPPPETEWEKTIGGSNYDCACSVQQATDGDYIMASATGYYGAVEGAVYLAKVNPWINTPAGSNVTVSLESADVTFQDILENGTTTMTTSMENLGELLTFHNKGVYIHFI